MCSIRFKDLFASGIIWAMTGTINSVMSQPRIDGEYYFGKMEMAAGFKFSEAKFQFFYTYGAIDRSATGTFVIAGDSVILKSDKVESQDFTLVSQQHAGKGYQVIFQDANSYLVKNISCVFVVNGKQHEVMTNDAGTASIDLEHCDTIYATHTLFPDVPTIVKDAGNINNRFKLRLNPSLGSLSFKGINLRIVNDSTLSCPDNYFMDASGILFKKQ